jgi:RNA recognition motif-containing protein
MSYHPHHEAEFNMDAHHPTLTVPFAGMPGREHHGNVPIHGTGAAAALAKQFANMSMGGMSAGNHQPGHVSIGQGTYQMVDTDGNFVPMQNVNGIPEPVVPGYGLPAHYFTPTPYAFVPPFMPFPSARTAVPQTRLDYGHSEVPGLENRRGSYSTNESAPTTPFHGGLANRDRGPRVAGLDRSTYTTPSPQQMAMPGHNYGSATKATAPLIFDRDMDELLKKEPAIPKAVPAVFTPVGQMKTLEQSLENRIPGNRNVYIRGLHPTTDDDLLYAYAIRFGAVETSKAIIDTGTGACKGFGFAKFFDPGNSEMCIRAFHRLGYEVGFARESFNSRLKAEGDDESTNLYISNLPKTLNEVELGTIFLGYTILSSKILRDSMGNSRGVGFARFENREVCDDVIRRFNGVGIGEEGLLMNIRYADTPAQKELKRVTAERRQFRTNEYNIGAYGTDMVGMPPDMFAAQHPQWRRGVTRSEFSSYMTLNSSAAAASDDQHGPAP